jgi:hypothetical protein
MTAAGPDETRPSPTETTPQSQTSASASATVPVTTPAPAPTPAPITRSPLVRVIAALAILLILAALWVLTWAVVTGALTSDDGPFRDDPARNGAVTGAPGSDSSFDKAASIRSDPKAFTQPPARTQTALLGWNS